MPDEDGSELSVYQSMNELLNAVERNFNFRHFHPIASDDEYEATESTNYQQLKDTI